SASAINGVISGNGTITKQGNALWVFGAANTDFAQRIINAGSVALNNGLGLGSPQAGTIVNNGGSLVPNAPPGGGTINVPEPLILNGAGSVDPGALAVESAGGKIIMTGAIALGSPTTVGSNV